MPEKYWPTECGFVIELDTSIYARAAVMKALYHLQDDYIISYERDGAKLLIYFDWLNADYSSEWKKTAAQVMREINFEMIRYDTMRATSHIRELIVGRALYATCVETEHDINVEPSSNESWKEDALGIFKSWSEGEEQ